ncbi:unnamed protein product [Brachionus calyciflorus]|uniref:Chromo domain-containing protein n=1 Tax=Brachionus calyciflorus TaxID=104777 RepID=A0A814KR30_9BILA|nr:unnamed protein product [Brachionus calyciflorus]
MDPEKIEAVKKWPVPSKVKHIRQFLVLCNSYRKFVKDFAKLAPPLTKLTKKDVKWDWTESCQKAFEELKEKLTSYPVLRAPVMSRKFILYTDASGLKLGAILCQKDENGIECVCAYASRPLKGAELHYGITEKEFLLSSGLLRSLEFTCTDANGRLARWAICLQTYTFEIVHRAGKKHLNADALSRAFAVVEELDEELDTDRSIKELDPWEDDFLLHFLRTGKYLPGSSKKQCKKIEKNKDKFSLQGDKLLYRKNIEDLNWKIVPKIKDRAGLKRNTSFSFPLNKLKIVSDTAIDNNEFYDIEKILKDRTRRGMKEYFVKWKGFPDEENSWVKESDFVSMDCLDEYLKYGFLTNNGIITNQSEKSYSMEPILFRILSGKIIISKTGIKVDILESKRQAYEYMFGIDSYNYSLKLSHNPAILNNLDLKKKIDKYMIQNEANIIIQPGKNDFFSSEQSNFMKNIVNKITEWSKSLRFWLITSMIVCIPILSFIFCCCLLRSGRRKAKTIRIKGIEHANNVIPLSEQLKMIYQMEKVNSKSIKEAVL